MEAYQAIYNDPPKQDANKTGKPDVASDSHKPNDFFKQLEEVALQYKKSLLLDEKPEMRAASANLLSKLFPPIQCLPIAKPDRLGVHGIDVITPMFDPSVYEACEKACYDPSELVRYELCNFIRQQIVLHFQSVVALRMASLKEQFPDRVFRLNDVREVRNGKQIQFLLNSLNILKSDPNPDICYNALVFDEQITKYAQVQLISLLKLHPTFYTELLDSEHQTPRSMQKQKVFNDWEIQKLREHKLSVNNLYVKDLLNDFKGN